MHSAQSVSYQSHCSEKQQQINWEAGAEHLSCLNWPYQFPVTLRRKNFLLLHPIKKKKKEGTVFTEFDK